MARGRIELPTRGFSEQREEQVRKSRQSGNEWRRARGYPLMQDLNRQAFQSIPV